jgi:D-serine deaminase-like pyridoxal phosphate-dependent protein
MMSIDNPEAVAGAFQGAERLASPQVVVDLARLEANIARVPAILPDSVELHPHVKTHKSFRIAALQRKAGAKGFTVSRPPEAAAFLRTGFGPVTVAFPLVSSREAAHLLRLAHEKASKVRFIVDSPTGVDAIAGAARGSGGTVDVLMKVDVGLHRCGVDPASQDAVELARRVTDSPSLRLVGLLSHAGHAYSAGDAAGVREVAAAELDQMRQLQERLAAAGLEASRISVGSTPTVLANAGFDGVDEARPGNYVFFDLAAVRLGVAKRREVALAVLATVVSANDRVAIVDAGSKTLSSDLGPHGSRTGGGYGEAYALEGGAAFPVIQLSEEHGFLALDGRALRVGAKVLILPNHSCTVVNLSERICILDGGKPEFVPVDARSGGPLRLDHDDIV